MSCPSALLSVTRLGAGFVGLIYGSVHLGTLKAQHQKKLQEKHAHPTAVVVAAVPVAIPADHTPPALPSAPSDHSSHEHH